MNKPLRSSQAVVLDTIQNINDALRRDPNALTIDRQGSVAPERAYIELIRELIALTHKK